MPLHDNSPLSPFPQELQKNRKREKRDFSFTLLPTEEALKRIGEAFDKKIFIYHPFRNSKSSMNVTEVTFEQVMNVLLIPLGYEHKEFEGDIVVVLQSKK